MRMPQSPDPAAIPGSVSRRLLNDVSGINGGTQFGIPRQKILGVIVQNAFAYSSYLWQNKNATY